MSSAANHRLSALKAFYYSAILLFIVGGILAPFATFGSNDNAVYRMIYNGQIGDGTPFPSTFFQNFTLGFFISKTFQLFPNFDWFSLTILVSQSLAFGCQNATFKILEKNRIEEWYQMVLLSLPFHIYFILNYHFTNVSIICSITGILLAFSAINFVHRSRQQRLLIVCGSITAFIGLIHRHDGFFMSTLLALPMMAVLWKQLTKNLLANLAYIALVASITIAVITLDSHQVKKIGLSDLSIFAPEASKLKDRRHPYRQSTLEATLPQQGWSKPELELFHNWAFFPTEHINASSLRALDRHLPKWDLQAHRIHARDSVIKFTIISFCSFLCIIAPWKLSKSPLPSSPKTIRLVLILVAWFIAILFLLYYFRKFPPWVRWPAYYALLTYAITIKTWTANTSDGSTCNTCTKFKNKIVRNLILFALVALTLFVNIGNNKSKSQENPSLTQQLLFDQCHKFGINKLYIMSFQPFNQRPFHLIETHDLEIVPSSVFLLSPIFERVTGKQPKNWADAFLDNAQPLRAFGTESQMKTLEDAIAETSKKSIVKQTLFSTSNGIAVQFGVLPKN